MTAAARQRDAAEAETRQRERCRFGDLVWLTDIAAVDREMGEVGDLATIVEELDLVLATITAVEDNSLEEVRRPGITSLQDADKVERIAEVRGVGAVLVYSRE